MDFKYIDVYTAFNSRFVSTSNNFSRRSIQNETSNLGNRSNTSSYRRAGSSHNETDTDTDLQSLESIFHSIMFGGGSSGHGATL